MHFNQKFSALTFPEVDKNTLSLDSGTPTHPHTHPDTHRKLYTSVPRASLCYCVGVSVLVCVSVSVCACVCACPSVSLCVVCVRGLWVWFVCRFCVIRVSFVHVVCFAYCECVGLLGGVLFFIVFGVCVCVCVCFFHHFHFSSCFVFSSFLGEGSFFVIFL